MTNYKNNAVKEARMDCQVKQLEKENTALRNHIFSLQGEVYGARLAAKYLDKELAGRYCQFQGNNNVHVHWLSFSSYFFFVCNCFIMLTTACHELGNALIGPLFHKKLFISPLRTCYKLRCTHMY